MVEFINYAMEPASASTWGYYYLSLVVAIGVLAILSVD